jgi:hypothetical protein
MGDFIEEPIDMGDVGDTAGPDSEALSTSLDTLNEMDPTDPSFEQQQAEVQQQQQAVLDKLSQSLGMSGEITQDTIEDASQDEPSTDDGKRLKDFNEKFQNQVKKSVAEIQDQNGESGKDIADSPETQKTIFEKYGMKALMVALAVGGLIGSLVLLKDMGNSMSGCYQVMTCASSQTAPVKVGCTTQTQCSCSGLTTGCANPPCPACAGPPCYTGGPGSAASPGCPNYYWQNISALQALGLLPSVITSPFFNAAGGAAKGIGDLVKKVAIYGGIIILILVIGYVAFNFIMRDIVNKNSKTGFRKRR